MRSVTVNQSNTEIEGVVYQANAVVTIKDSTFSALTTAGRFSGGSPVLTDNGAVSDDGDTVYTQGTHVNAPAALTASAPAALTAAAAATDPPTKVEFDKVVADLTALRTNQAALVTDITALRTTLAAVISGSTGAGKPLHT